MKLIKNSVTYVTGLMCNLCNRSYKNNAGLAADSTSLEQTRPRP